MKKVIVTTTIVALGLMMNIALAEMKIGIVDVNKVLQNDPQVKVLQNDIQKQFRPVGQKIVKERQSLVKDVEILKKMSDTNKTAKQSLSQKVIKEANDLRADQIKLQQDLIVAQRNALNIVAKKVNTVIVRIAGEQKLDLVMAKSALAFVSNEMTKTDITDQVIKSL